MGEGGGQQYCLKWNNYQVRQSSVTEVILTDRRWPNFGVFVNIFLYILFQESLSSTFSDLLASDTFVDVTLSCEGQKVLMFYNVHDRTICDNDKN